MIQKKKRPVRLILLGVVLAGVLCFTGCGKETAHIEEGMQAIEALDYTSALSAFEQAIVAQEDLQLAYRGQGLCYLGLTDYEKAVKSFEKALSNAGMFVSDTEVDINYYLATAQYKNGQKEEALKTLDAIAGMRKKEAEVYYLRGLIKMETGDYEGAVPDLDTALTCAKWDNAMTIRVYQVFADNGHVQEGKSYLSAALERGLDSMSDYEKGTIYYYVEDYENARNFLETARSNGNEEDRETLLMLGKTYEQLGDSNYAASLYSKYLESAGDDAVIYNQLGLCKLKNSEYEAALNAFNSGLAVEGGGSVTQQLRFNQIVAYEYLGDFEKAAALMNGYLESYPDDSQARREYEFLRTR